MRFNTQGGQPSPLNCAVGLLSRRDHSQGELQRKMRERGYSDDDIYAAITRCIELGYQDDGRFTELFIRYRSQRGLGPQRLRAALRERGVASDLIEATLRHSDVDFFELCRACRERKFGLLLPVNFKEQAKQQRYLAYRGFSMEMIRYAMSQGE
ncbi:MAG: regulatory protein RecX [Ferrimonas sp.]